MTLALRHDNFFKELSFYIFLKKRHSEIWKKYSAKINLVVHPQRTPSRLKSIDNWRSQPLCQCLLKLSKNGLKSEGGGKKKNQFSNVFNLKENEDILPNMMILIRLSSMYYFTIFPFLAWCTNPLSLLLLNYMCVEI